MSYFAGAYGLERIGIPSGDPRIECDGCGLVLRVYRQGAVRMPYAWFMNNKPAPGWSLQRIGDGGEKRIDKCPRCRTAQAADTTRNGGKEGEP